MISGWTCCGGGGGALGFGMSSFTAWFMTGSVRMSMTTSTSITSINGVVLISQIASPSSLSPTDIDMVGNLLQRPLAHLGLVGDALSQGLSIRLRDEPDFDDSAARNSVEDTTDRLEEGVLVGPDMDLRLRLHHGLFFDL